MTGTTYPIDLSGSLWNSYVLLSLPGCMRFGGDTYLVLGPRPIDGRWHKHGYFARQLWVLVKGAPRQVTLLKSRWRRVGTNETCHSRLPCEVGRRTVSELLLVLLLWIWLDGTAGLHSRLDAESPVSEVVSRRTQQRYLAMLLPNALSYQQILRETIIERSEPRPAKHLYPRGLSPPKRLLHHGWLHPTKTCQLWSGLTILFNTVERLQIPAARLLAEARGKETHGKHPLAE